MSEPSNTEKRDHFFPTVRGRTITDWHMDNFLKKPYNVTNKISEVRKLFWLYTSYIHCEANAEQMIGQRTSVFKTLEFPNYPAEFLIIIHEQDAEVIIIEICRFMKHGHSIPDEGYFLRLSLEICGSQHSGMFTDMTSDMYAVCVPFEINDCFKDFNLNEEIVIKCVFWMCEMTNLDTSMAFLSQNESLLQNLRDSTEVPENALSALEFIMGCENLNCVFSGRQEEEFVQNKILLLTRALKFSTILAERLRFFEESTPFEYATPIGVILGYIKTGFIREIFISECVELYHQAFTYSIPFLKKETSLFLSENLTGPSIDLNVILSASAVDDWKLMDIGIDYFIRFKDTVVSSDRWKNLLHHQTATIQILAKKRENYHSMTNNLSS